MQRAASADTAVAEVSLQTRFESADGKAESADSTDASADQRPVLQSTSRAICCSAAHRVGQLDTLSGRAAELAPVIALQDSRRADEGEDV